MKTIHAIAFVILVLPGMAAHAGTAIINLSVSGEISPGVYGQVQLGNTAPPPVVYAKPMIIGSQPAMAGEPIYLSVPPGHAKKWAKHCSKYNACNRPVYFVKTAEYEPDYSKHKGRGRSDEGRGGDEERGDEGNGNRGNRGRGHRD